MSAVEDYEAVLPRFAGFAAFGVAVSLALHLYFLSVWPLYVASISAERLKQTGGRIPEASMAGTSLGSIHAMLFLALAGVLIGTFVRRDYWLAGAGFATGVGITHVVLVFLVYGMGNLWPFTLATTLVMTGGAAWAGAALISFIRSRASRWWGFELWSR